jgi:hypothetical protein
MSMKDNFLGSPSDGQCMEDSGKSSILSQVVPAGAASTAGAFCVFKPNMVENRPLTVFGMHMPVVFQAHGMVKIACRRHDRSPLVSEFRN